MTGEKDKASPAKSDAAPLPPLDDGHPHDQPAGGSTSNSIDDVNMQAISNSLQNGDTSSNSMPVDNASPKPAADADDADKPVRSASVQAAEAAKRRENNFLEKLWNWLDSEASHGIMQFSVNGRYLLILDPDAVPEALDAAGICKHKNYGSFQRQCCIYGWRRMAQAEVPKLILDDDEEPGATIALLGENIKVMQHESLVRDSPREEVRSVTRKAKPKPSRAKDAEARAIANERMAAEQAEREARQQKQAELLALHRQEEKERQEAQKRKEDMKLHREESQPSMDDLTYDPALPPAPPMSSSIVLDPSLAGLTGSMQVSTNTLGAAQTIPKQANSNTTTTTKKPKGTYKKRKAAAAAANDKGEDQENRYDNDDIQVHEEMAKRAKKKQTTVEPQPQPTTVTFDDIAALSTLDIHADPFATVHTSTESASANFDNFFANAFDPSRFQASVPAAAPPISSSIINHPQLGVTPSGANFDALPKSLQEAFLTIDKNTNEQNSNPSSSTATPTNADNAASNVNSMIDPSLTSFNSPSLPPLPPQPTAATQPAPSYPNTTSLTIPSATSQMPTQSTYGTMGSLDLNYGIASSLPSAGALTSGLHNPSSFYYQPPPMDAFADLTSDPNLPPHNVAPPYFSSAFSGLADLQATNW